MTNTDTPYLTGGPMGLAMHATLAIALFLSASISNGQSPIATTLVDPFIGTGGHGHTFPGACVPFGLVQLSPDTRPDGIHDWDGASGYHYSDSIIYGFSHTHLSGTGVSDLCDVLLMPTTGSGTTDPNRYRSSFHKASEHAHAGYYRVHLDGPDVGVELTASPRTGMHRYAFPAGKEAFLTIDLEHRDFVENASIVRVGDREVTGERRSSSWARDQRLFYCIRTSHPFAPREADNPLAETIAAHQRSQDILRFGDLMGEPLVVKVGISAVSIEGARKNLEAEVPHWDFDQVKREAETTWDRALGRIHIRGGEERDRRIFYTALYHTMIAPCIFNDVDGNYRGMDGEVHHADHDVYTVFSLWDTFRALHPLMTILEPDRTRDWIRTMLLHHQQGGRLPIWELWGNETDCMIGHHAVSVIADAHAKGIRGFDEERALEAMVSSAELDRFGLKHYRERGYISSEDEPESVSKTLEYAYNDACIARYAEALGRQGIAAHYKARSRNWHNLFDPVTGFFRPRRNGGFIEPFDPHEVNFHFTEANAWHYALFVPHDMERYIELLGGQAGLTEKLDALFTADTRTTGRDQSDITGLIGQYAHGNEPSHNYAYLYSLSSRHYSMDVWLKRIMDDLYTDAPDGLSGNEDCGQMSAWYVLSALGLYPIDPGDPNYTLGLPRFPEAVIHLGDGRRLRIIGESEGGSRDHVTSISWNGGETAGFRRMDHAALMQGGELRFYLGPRPGSAPVPDQREDRRRDPGPMPVPIIQAPGQAFADSVRISVTSIPGPWHIVINTEHDAFDPKRNPRVRDNEVTLYRDGYVRAICADGTGRKGMPVSARFVKRDNDRTVELESNYAPQYAAGGDQALVDGLRGGQDFRTGEWQGFEAQDVLATVDLGRPMRIRRLGLGVLQDIRSWIWYPANVTFAVSMNQRQWSTMEVANPVPQDAEGAMKMDLWTEPMDKRVRYIKVMATSIGPCPEWHPGAGHPGWIFTDEILVEPY
ncbi:MAG: GH92 family glycosyl hydrolase [Flavobacteriales bacterium]|nr:GH92 family glycosyl hydrolase [Flavobacteriales bacterium]